VIILTDRLRWRKLIETTTFNWQAVVVVVVVVDDDDDDDDGDDVTN